MKWLLVVVLSVMLFTACPHAIKIYDGPPVDKNLIWVVENPPDELIVERTTEKRGTEKLVVKKEKADYNPFTYIAGVFSDVVALLFGTLGGVTPSVGQ